MCSCSCFFFFFTMATAASAGFLHGQKTQKDFASRIILFFFLRNLGIYLVLYGFFNLHICHHRHFIWLTLEEFIYTYIPLKNSFFVVVVLKYFNCTTKYKLPLKDLVIKIDNFDQSFIRLVFQSLNQI